MSNTRVLQPPRNLSPDLRLQSQLADLFSRVGALELSSLQGKTALPFDSKWGSFGSGHEDVTYYRDRGRVYLQGLATVVTATTANPTVATLPAGYRPSGRLIFYCYTSLSGNIVRVDIFNTGVIQVQTGSAMSVGAFVNLSGISFRTA
jgi:hypothetical protein